MTSMRKNILGCLTATALASGLMVASTSAQAGELAATAAISNMYLWRGIDLGDGSAAVSGDLTYSFGPGFRTGVWISSGDSTLGQEYDYFIGWGQKFGEFGVDLSLWNYNYSDFDGTDDTTGELSEAVLTLSYAGAALGIYNNISGQGPIGGTSEGYEYYTFSYTYDKYSALVGYHDPASDADSDMTHLDVSYAYNDNLSFTVSKIIDEGDDDGYDNDVNFVLKYSLPIN